MSISPKKKLSSGKELFLSICLMAGEISSDTVKAMKGDYGEATVSEKYIYYFKSKGYLAKIGEGSNYGFILTRKGYEYAQAKLPHKHNYNIYEYLDSHIYETRRREKRRQFSLILYYLYKNGIDITDHSADVEAIFNNQPVNVVKPFFASLKELSRSNTRTSTAYGTRAFGAIVTPQKVVVIYSSSKAANLLPQVEAAFHTSLISSLREAAAPYCIPNNVEYLFMFKNFDDFADAFSLEGKNNGRASCTYRCFTQSYLLTKTTYSYIMRKSAYTILDILNPEKVAVIDRLFIEAYSVKPFASKGLAQFHVAGHYQDTSIPVFIAWTLSPTILTSILTYIQTDGFGEDDEVYICCFDENEQALFEVTGQDRKVANHVSTCTLSKKEIDVYLAEEPSAYSDFKA